MITPRDFLKTVIDRWEGGYQSYADDQGNYVQHNGVRIRIGTMRGVTPDALAKYRGVAPWTLTPDIMRSVTLDEAADIGFQHYYVEPNINLLLWGPATAGIVDFGWMSGPPQAVLSLQRLIGAKPDGVIGTRETVPLYASWIDRLGWAAALQAVHDMRAAFYRYLAQIHPEDEQFLQGWLNRDDWASAANPEFLSAFACRPSAPEVFQRVPTQRKIL